MSLSPSIVRQGLFMPKPTLTEKNCPDQSGRLHIITGAYSGLGLELAKILYQHNATLFLAGRSPEKAESAVAQLQTLYPDSKGSVETIIVDFSDLSTIKPAVQPLIDSARKVHGLTLNAGVMWTPEGSTSAHGFDLQLATNCLGSYAFYRSLRPLLAPGSRVTWASSLTMEVQSPKHGGIAWDGDAPSQKLSIRKQYAQTKAGNTHIAAVLARRDCSEDIVHVSFNPGNLQTDLQRHYASAMRNAMNLLLYSNTKLGAYTELFALLGNIPKEKSGAYVAPWGRVQKVSRKDIQKELDDSSKNSVSQRFVRWLEKETQAYC